MISQLAKGDYEDMIAAGLPATLEDFDRLNCIALRLTDGSETTAANFPRIGWAGDVPFYQPTCIAISWYLQFVERAPLDGATKDACWWFALQHGREISAFAGMETPGHICTAVNKWLGSLPVTRDEIARACRYAVSGFDDATPAKTPAKEAEDANLTDLEKREQSIADISLSVSCAAASTGIESDVLLKETPSRLALMVAESRRLHHDDRGITRDERKLRADYDMTRREIIIRLRAEKSAKDAKENAENG